MTLPDFGHRDLGIDDLSIDEGGAESLREPMDRVAFGHGLEHGEGRLSRQLRVTALLLAAGLSAGCDDPVQEMPTAPAPETASIPPGIAPGLPAPGSAVMPAEGVSAAVLTPPPEPKCPEEMVEVLPKAGRPYCVDRYEATLVDDETGAVLSPYYPPDPGKARYLGDLWKKQSGEGTAMERAMKLPELPAWQKQPSSRPKATSKKGHVPQGYASGKDADVACKNAGKRLCTAEEWKTACRGEQDRLFPYGDTFEQGKCNIFREAHPGVLLWDDPTINHTDPRLNLVKSEKGPLLRVTGATPECASKWGDDAIMDMVGNLDEWIDDSEGTFVGGFYSRGKKDGCDSKVESHGLTYADYSTGIRCCSDMP